MRRSRPRWLTVAMLITSGAVTFVLTTGACQKFGAQKTLTAVDWCYIFDCQNGLFGGLVDPCNGDPVLFADCNGGTTTNGNADATNQDTTDATDVTNPFGF